MPDFFKIAIVILNFNGNEDTFNCLKSVYQIDYPNFVTIVVDNGSRQNPGKQLLQEFKNIYFIRNEENLGFAEGSNVGIKKALELNCDFVLLLNNDTVVDKNLLKAFSESVKKNPKTGVFGGSILRYDDQLVIDHLGGIWDKTKGDFLSLHANKKISDLTELPDKKVEYVCGCLMLIKKQVFEKIGFLEKKFFLLWEESDFCFRARKKGFEITAVKEAMVWHKISASFSGGKIHSDYYWWRNRMLWIDRNLPKLDKLQIYIRIIIPQIFKLFKLNFLKSIQYFLLKKLNKSKLNEKKILQLLRYKAGCRGVWDYFFKNFGPCPSWITEPKKHVFFKNFQNSCRKTKKNNS